MAETNVDKTELQEPERRGRPGKPIELRRLVLAVTAARWIFVWTAVAGVLVGVVVAKTVVSQTFGATTILEWQPPAGASPSESSEDAMQTLVSSVKLPSNIIELRQRLALETTLERLGARISARAAPQSRLMMISATSDDPEEAVELVDATVNVFLDSRIATESARMEQNVARLDIDRAEAVKRVEAAQKAYDEFLIKNGVTDVAAETEAAIAQHSDLLASADLAKAEALAEKARRESFDMAAARVPDTATLTQRETIPSGASLADAIAQRTALRARLTPEHPLLKELNARITALRKGVSSNTATPAERTVGLNPQWSAARAAESAAAAAERAALTRQATFMSLAGEAQARLDKLGAINSPDTVLRSALSAAEERLGEIEQAIAFAQDAARSPSTNLEVVSPASPPTLPEKSYRKLVAAGIPILFMICATVYVLVRAVWGLRAFTASEVAFWGQMPVLASSLWPKTPTALDDLVAELSSGWGHKRGDVLIVALSDVETQATSALAREILRVTTHGAPPDLAGSASPIRFWDRTPDGAAFRRAVRESETVIVVVESGTHSALRLGTAPTQFGRLEGIGLVVVGVDANFAACADRAGDVEAFWNAEGAAA